MTITVSSVITGTMTIGAAAVSEAAGSGAASGVVVSTCAGVCANSAVAAIASDTRVLRSSDSHSANLNEEIGQVPKLVEATVITLTVWRKGKKRIQDRQLRCCHRRE